MIRYLCQAVCYGCRAPVTVWQDGVRTTLRDVSLKESPVHLCADPQMRERIELPTTDLLAYSCWRCGEQDVAPTTWGRVVDFPSSNIDELAWAEAWLGPLHEHTCAPKAPVAAPSALRPVWEAFKA